MARKSGFTLVELMVAIVIVGTLAAVAIVAYKRYFARARSSEVMSMFGEIRVKEEAYRTEFSVYQSTSTVSESDIYPALIAGQEPKVKLWAPAAGTGWQFLAVNPGRLQLYCGYNVIAGPPGGWGYGGWASAGGFIQPFFSNTPAGDQWWAAVAMCDNDNISGTLTDGNNATYITASTNSVVRDLWTAR